MRRSCIGSARMFHGAHEERCCEGQHDDVDEGVQDAPSRGEREDRLQQARAVAEGRKPREACRCGAEDKDRARRFRLGRPRRSHQQDRVEVIASTAERFVIAMLTSSPSAISSRLVAMAYQHER